ncbi:MAG: HD domain-containing protein [Cohaesibacteraceae bacterium]|nr:HD domain-containing protein [Cohaesibacteraceae bacterium]
MISQIHRNKCVGPDTDDPGKIYLADLVSAFSVALDMTEGQPAGHSIRCCWIGFQIGVAFGIDEADLSDLYYTILLKDLGCSSNAARICELYLTDDLTFKHDVKTIDGSMSQALRFVLSHTCLKAGLAERFRTIVRVIQDGSKFNHELVQTRCYRGADIARRMRFSEMVADGIQNLDERWDGSGLPGHISGPDIPLFSRIALLAQVVDVFQTANGRDAALQEIRSRSGSWFDPDFVETFEQIAGDDCFWSTLSSDELNTTLHRLQPRETGRPVDEDYLDDIAEAFAGVVDAKSPFTSGHSERVTLYTDLIAQQLGFDARQRRWLKRAALLHDLGKLGISNSILDKPDQLTDEEFDQIKLHPVYSENILANIAAFADIAPIAGGHHERLDGRGYPRGLKGSEIDIHTRIVTVADIFDALTADRPYRAAMPVTKALTLMSDMVGTAIDQHCFEALQLALIEMDQDQVA